MPPLTPHTHTLGTHYWLKFLLLSCLPPPPILVPTEKKLEEFLVEEAEVLQILTQVNVVRRECEIVSVQELILGTQGAPFEMGTTPHDSLSLSPSTPET